LKKELDISKHLRYHKIMNDRNWGGARIGAGRKPTGKNIENITLTLTHLEAKILKVRAEEDGLTVSRFVSKWLNLVPLTDVEKEFIK